MEIFNRFITILDWLFAEMISPVFRFVGEGLELVVLKPLTLLHLPVVLQIAAVGVLTGMFSQLLRKVMRVEEKEASFQRKFAAKKSLQQPIAGLEDWKARDVLYRASDKELDEDFNTYLAQRFARYGFVYLLPIFGTLFWLETALPPEKLVVRQSGAYVLALPENAYGVEGFTVSMVFLVVYLVFQIVFFGVKKRWKRKRGTAPLQMVTFGAGGEMPHGKDSGSG